MLGWIIDECEIVGIGDPVLLGVVAYDDGSASQMRGDEFERRSRHRNPDIDQREVYRPVDLSECLPQIALSEIDETGQTRFLEMRPCRSCLLGLVLRADYHALAAGSTKVVAQGGSQINRRDAISRADLDDPAGIDSPAKLIAELGLVAVERVELVAQKGLGSSGLILWRSTDRPITLIVVVADSRVLRIALYMQLGKQTFQDRIVKDTHIG